MFQNFRQSLAWMHTWLGLVFGFVLMVAFFFGALSVFDREIDRWALPETRFEPQIMPSYDGMLAQVFPLIEPEAEELAAARTRVEGELPDTLQVIGWGAYTTHRDPVLSLYAEFAVPNNPDDPYDHVHGHITIDPRNGEVLSHDQLKIGSDFFYPLHYGLHIHWKNIGIWIVGIAALVMLAALISGVVMHRKFFREFFTFRPHKRTQRSALDLHNLTGVVALPFHFFFALSGLTIFAGIYLPVSNSILEPLAMQEAVLDARQRGLPFAPAGEAAGIASVDAMVAEAKRRWAHRGMPGEVGFFWVSHLGDTNSFVSIYRAGSDRVTRVGQAVHFSAITGEVIYEEPPLAPASAVNEFLTGLHLQHFEHWLLRWLYVMGGLAGAVCIATGFIYLVEKSKRRHAEQGLGGSRWVDALAVTTVTGMVVATFTILVANRLLPTDLEHRGSWEEGAFWVAWLLTLAHAAWRSNAVSRARVSPAWREQCWMIVGMALVAVFLNATTTGDNLINTIIRGYWAVAGLDLALLVSALIATKAALILKRKEEGLAAKIPTADPIKQSAEMPHG